MTGNAAAPGAVRAPPPRFDIAPIAAVAAILALVLTLALLLRLRVLPLQDFDIWTYQASLLARFMQGGTIPAMVKFHPVPNMLSQYLQAVLVLVMPARASAIAVVLLLFAGWCIVGWVLAGGDRVRFAIILGIAALNSPFWDGYMGFEFGLLLFFAAILLERRGLLPAWLEVVAAVLIFLTHALPGGLLVLRRLLMTWQDGRWGRAAAVALPVGILAVVYAAKDHAYGNNGLSIAIGSLAHLVAYHVYTLAKFGPYQNFFWGPQGDLDLAPTAFWIGVAVNLAYAVLVVLPLIALVPRIRPKHDAWLAGFCCFAFLLAPAQVLGIINLGERLLAAGLILAVATVPDRWRWRLHGAIFACLLPLVPLRALFTAPQGPVPAVAPLRISGVSNLFWHRPYFGQDEFLAAAQGRNAPRLGFDTGPLAHFPGTRPTPPTEPGAKP